MIQITVSTPSNLLREILTIASIVSYLFRTYSSGAVNFQFKLRWKLMGHKKFSINIPIIRFYKTLLPARRKKGKSCCLYESHLFKSLSNFTWLHWPFHPWVKSVCLRIRTFLCVTAFSRPKLPWGYLHGYLKKSKRNSHDSSWPHEYGLSAPWGDLANHKAERS